MPPTPARGRGSSCAARQSPVQSSADVGLADTEYPRELGVGERPWNFSSTSSRSRALRFATRPRPRPGLHLGQGGVGTGVTQPARITLRRSAPGAAAQLIERRVPRDREQQPTGGSAAGIEPASRSVETLERQRRDVLGGGSVSEHRHRVSVTSATQLRNRLSKSGPALARGRRVLAGLGVCVPSSLLRRRHPCRHTSLGHHGRHKAHGPEYCPGGSDGDLERSRSGAGGRSGSPDTAGPTGRAARGLAAGVGVAVHAPRSGEVRFDGGKRRTVSAPPAAAVPRILAFAACANSLSSSEPRSWKRGDMRSKPERHTAPPVAAVCATPSCGCRLGHRLGVLGPGGRTGSGRAATGVARGGFCPRPASSRQLSSWLRFSPSGPSGRRFSQPRLSPPLLSWRWPCGRWPSSRAVAFPKLSPPTYRRFASSRRPSPVASPLASPVSARARDGADFETSCDSSSRTRFDRPSVLMDRALRRYPISEISLPVFELKLDTKLLGRPAPRVSASAGRRYRRESSDGPPAAGHGGSARAGSAAALRPRRDRGRA